MAEVKEKNKLGKGMKAFAIAAAAVAAIVVIGILIINMLVKPIDSASDKAIPVGGMISSESVNFKSESADGLEGNLIIKIMQLVWKSCAASDAKVHDAQTPPEGIEKIKNIPYIADGNVYHQLDVFYPEGTTGKLPVIIDIHGGGWMYGDKDLNENYCLALANRGYTVFSISYRLVPDVTVNEQIQDCAAALRWISENMAAYPCESENILLTGDSAGGQLAVYEAVLAQSSELREIFQTEDPKLDITALLLTSPVSYMKSGGGLSIYSKLLWGRDYRDKPTFNYMDLNEIIDYAGNMPPTYLITSSGDSLAHSQTLKAYELLQQKGVKSELADYGKVNGKKLAHVFSVLNPYDEAGTQAIDCALVFYEGVISQRVR